MAPVRSIPAILAAVAGMCLCHAIWPGGVAEAQVRRSASHTVLTQASRQRAAWFICDGTNRPIAVVVGLPGSGRRIWITTFPKSAPLHPHQAFYHVSTAEPGAGQVYYSLTQNGRSAGNLHAFNPGMLGKSESAFTPPFAAVTLGKQPIICRWMPYTRLISVGRHRTVVVTQSPSGSLTFQSFDFDKPGRPLRMGAQQSSTPTLTLTGGHATATQNGHVQFAFVHDNLSCTISVPPAGSTVPASITERRDGRVIRTEKLLAYTYAPPHSKP